MIDIITAKSVNEAQRPKHQVQGQKDILSGPGKAILDRPGQGFPIVQYSSNIRKGYRQERD